MEKLQNNSEIWKKIACDMQQLRVSQPTPPPTPRHPLRPPPPPPPTLSQSLSSTTITTEDLWRNWGVAAEIFQNGGMNLLHPGTQEAHIHMHFYLRPNTATQKAEISKALPFILQFDK